MKTPPDASMHLESNAQEQYLTDQYHLGVEGVQGFCGYFALELRPNSR